MGDAHGIGLQCFARLRGAHIYGNSVSIYSPDIPSLSPLCQLREMMRKSLHIIHK
uniref:Uncharacterized protein n=1 Tax=Anguilla anguilla TaxID=7936 RepID=A0A0E9RXS5_ANGAN